MRRTILLINALMFMLLFPALNARGQEASEALSLSVQGERFVDGSGRQVILRGANAGMRSKLPPFYPFDPEPDFETALTKYADAFSDLGFNAVRLLVIWEAVEPMRGEYDENFLAIYDQMVEAFAARGVHVIIDSHQDIVSRRFCGDGFPDWALARRYRHLPQHANCSLWELHNFTFAVASSWDRFWMNKDGIQDRYVAMFKMLAERYRDQPMVIGFEPINEPMTGGLGAVTYSSWNQKRLFGLFEAVGRAVHEVDPRFLVFADTCPIENLGTWSKSRPRPQVDNLVSAPHYYDVGYVKMEWSTGRDREVMKNGLSRHLGLARTWRVPVIVGEYGIEMQREDAPEYVNNLYSVFDELLLSGTIWEASMSATLWNGRDKNIFNPDGSLRPGTLALDRPYPRAVAGEIESFSFDPASGVFKLRFTESGKISLPTEVYLPKRVYHDDPEVKVEPEGRVEFDAERRLLMVYPVGEKSGRKVIVRPKSRG